MYTLIYLSGFALLGD